MPSHGVRGARRGGIVRAAGVRRATRLAALLETRKGLGVVGRGGVDHLKPSAASDWGHRAQHISSAAGALVGVAGGKQEALQEQRHREERPETRPEVCRCASTCKIHSWCTWRREARRPRGQ